MNFDSMKTPRTRAEFERNFHLLRQQIADKKFFIAQELSRSIDGLDRVRFLPNGRMDFLSVDESARLQANMMNQFGDELFEEQLKEKQTSANESRDEKDCDVPPIGSDAE